jgi:hypothetical protein
MTCHARREWRRQALDRTPKKIVMPRDLAVQNSDALKISRQFGEKRRRSAAFQGGKMPNRALLHVRRRRAPTP